MSEHYSCWGKDWDDWLKAEEERQEEHRFDREKIEEEPMIDCKSTERIPCEKCGEYHTVEVNVSTFQGVINKCSELQDHKEFYFEKVQELEARVEELETENKNLLDANDKAEDKITGLKTEIEILDKLILRIGGNKQ